MTFSKIFFHLSPFLFYTVSGNSMLPAYKDKDFVVAQRIFLHLREHDVVILTHPKTKRLLMKRIQKIENNSYFVIGDNEGESTDSRHFGWISKQNILAKVLKFF